MSATRERFDDGVEVEFERIEPALRSLWKQGLGRAAENAPPATRVATLNLVALAGTEADAEAALRTSSDLTVRHPGRVIVVQAQEQGPDSVRARVTMECRTVGSGRQVCSEQVRLLVSGESARLVAQAVAPLLVPDVPMMLWLPANPLALPIDEDLLALADCVITDAHCFADARTALARLAAWRKERRLVVDLAWLRLERWRSLTAQMFEGEEARRDLERVDNVHVTYFAAARDAPEGRVEALYYLAWLADRLDCRWERGLQPAPSEQCFAARAPDRRAVELSLARAARPEAGFGDLSGVEIRAGESARYWIERSSARHLGKMRIESSRSSPGPTRVGLPCGDDLDLLARAVAWRAPDPLFERVLAGARWLADAG